MDDRYFPPIPPAVVAHLATIRMLADEDPGYFEDPNCPYDEELVALFVKEPEPQVDIGPGERWDGDFDAEAERLYTELRSFGQSLDSADTAEKNTYFRLSVSLIEKLVELKERAVGVKKVREFTDTVLQIMEDELSPDQRTAIMKRLREILGD